MLTDFLEAIQRSIDADEAPLPAPFEDKSSEAESHMTPLVKSKARSRSPYTDRFGLRQPPPPSKLYGGDNLHYLTGVCVIDATMRNSGTDANVIAAP